MSHAGPLEAVFFEALEKGSPEECAAFLDEACAGDADLRRRVEKMLFAHAGAGSFLETPAAQVAPTIDMPGEIAEGPGTVIGPYKLLEQLGEGGFGVVFLAEQQRPVRRRVALKIIKPGMDTREVIARFEAERQALALMDHPNIAKIHDAGTTGGDGGRQGAGGRSQAEVREGTARPLTPDPCLQTPDVPPCLLTPDLGRPYFVMELVKGIPITEYCDRHNLAPRERLELFATVCQAVQHAHHKGVIHRDIKPSNVLVTLHDGRPVPKVIDFGLAKAMHQRLTDKTLFTQFAQMLGTPLYMSPEQAEHSGLDIDTRSDIYSLGAMLYELLTGSTPFLRQRLRDAALGEILRMIREEEPPRPSLRLSSMGDKLPGIAAHRHTEPKKLGAILRGELDWIVMKALEKDRTRRYETANGFAADILRHLNDEPVTACPPSAAYRFRKFARRNRVAFSTAALVLAALIVGTFISTWQAIRATRAEDLAETRLEAEAEAKSKAIAARTAAEKAQQAEAAQRKIAQRRRAEADQQRVIAQKNAQEAQAQSKRAAEQEEIARREAGLARRRFYAAQMNLAQQAWEVGDPSCVRDLLETQRPRFDEEDLRAFEWYHLWRLCHKDLKFTLGSARLRLGGHVAWSPDGETIATPGTAGAIILWDADTGKELRRLQGRPRGWQHLAFSPDGTLLAQACGPTGNEVIVWDLTTGKAELLEGTGYVRWLAFSPNGRTLATGSNNVKLWEVGAWRERAILDVQPPGVLQLAFSPDSRLLATTSSWAWVGGRVQLWDVTTDPPEITVDFPWAGGIAFGPDGKTLAATSSNQGRLWDIATGKELATYPVVSNHANYEPLAFSSDGQTLAYATQPRSVGLWNRPTGQTRTLAQTADVNAVEFSPDSRSLAVSSSNGTVEVWDLAPQPDALTLSQSKLQRVFGRFGTTPMAFSPDGQNLAVSSTDGAIKLWNVETGQERAVLRGTAGGYGTVAWSPDGKLLASARGGWDEHKPGEVTLWDISTRDVLTTFGKHPGQAWSVSFSPDGKFLATGSHDGTVNLWDVATYEQRSTYRTAAVKVLAFSPDSTILAAGGHDGFLKFHDPSTGRQMGAITDQEPVASAAYSPAGDLFGIGDDTGTIRLRDRASLEVRAVLKGHTSAVVSLCFFPDGRTLASGSGDGTVKLWDVIIAQERLTLNHGNFLAVSPDGKTLAVAGPQAVTLWRASTDQEAIAFKTELDLDDPDSPLSQIDAGDRLSRDGRPDDAEKVYRKAVARLEKLAAQFPDAREYRHQQSTTDRRLGELMRSAGRSREARVHFQRAVELLEVLVSETPHNAGYRNDLAGTWACCGLALAAGQQHHEAEQALGRALALWKQLSDEDPESEWYRHERASFSLALGNLLQAAGRTGDALEYCRASVRLNEQLAADFPDHRTHLQRLANARGVLIALLSSLGREKEAAEERRKQEASAEAQAAQRDALREQEQLAKAEAALREANQREEARGRMLLRQQQFPKAEAAFREVVRLRPDVEAYTALAEVLRQQHKFAEAEAALREAIRLNPNRPQTHDVLGWLLIQQNQLAAAEIEFRQVIRLNATAARGHYGLGSALHKQNKSAEAIAALSEAVRLDPSMHYVHGNLGWIYVTSGDFANAESEFRELIRLRPDLAAAHFGLGRALVEQQKFAEAETALREVLRREPAHRFAPQLLGRALIGQGRRSEAEELLKQKPAHNTQDTKKSDKPAEPVEAPRPGAEH